MSTNEKNAVKRFYANWHGALKCKKNKPKRVKAFFMGGWCTMTDKQASYLLGLLTKKDRKVLMTYPIWM
jgi:hypothetical protein